MPDQPIDAIVKYLIEKADQLINSYKMQDGITKIDYVAIFPKSAVDETSLVESLKHIGLPVKETPTGTIYKLTTFVEMPQGEVQLVKIKKFDKNRTQRGYIDYEVADYQKFKMENLSKGVVEISQNAEGMEMLKLVDPEVLIFFPENPLGKAFI